MATAATNLNVTLRGDVIYQASNSDLQTAATFATKPNSAYHVLIKAVAYRTDTDSSAAAYYKRALFRTNAAGTLTQVSTTQSVATDIEDQAGWQFLVQGVGTTIAVIVGGEGAPAYWAITSEIRVVDTQPQV